MSAKSMRMTKVVVVLCVAALTAFASIAQAEDQNCACDMHGEQGWKHHQGFMKFAKKLGLTDAQKEQAKTIFTENKESAKLTVASLKTEHKILRDLLHADTVNEVAIRAEVTKIANIRADLVIIRAKAMAKFRTLLTPAQLEILKTQHHSHEKK
jgi:Spy/CpxP family protein refolding chaperone